MLCDVFVLCWHLTAVTALSVLILVEELLHLDLADIVAVEEMEGIVFTLSDSPGGGELMFSTDMCCSFGVVLNVEVHSTGGIALEGVALGVMIT